MTRRILLLVLLGLGASDILYAQQQGQGQGQRRRGQMGMAQMDPAYIALAESGAPPTVAQSATIARADASGRLMSMRRGTNGFTCIVGVPGDPNAPICMDENATRWFADVASGQPRPTNNAPGIAYMAKGGLHWETARGDAVMDNNANNARQVQEPPHWMVMWPFTAEASGLPTRENPSGVYIMFAGTPYAHLMVYQNPMTMQGRGGRRR
jgi:hypothetical protein